MSALPPCPSSWKVLNHGPLEAVGVGCWRVVGSLPNMGLPRTCVVARCGEGELLIHSAIALRDEVLAEVLALGTPRWLVVPNGMHRLDAPAWKERFPSLTVVCPPAARAKVEEVVPVDTTLDALESVFGPEHGVSVHPLPGVNGAEWALGVHHEGGSVSLVVTDAVFNLPHQPGVGGLVMRLIGSSGGPKVTFVARQLLVKNRAELAEGLRSLAALPGLCRVIPAHGDPIEGDVAQTLRQVADQLHQ